MRTLKRKKVNSFNSLLLFILSSVLFHGLLLFIFAQSRRSLPLIKQKTDQKPIDFVVIPPEETVKEPPPETKKIAKNNSVAKGEVKPDLPVASNKAGDEAASVQAAKPAPAVKKATPKPELQKIFPPEPQAEQPQIQSELIKPEAKPQPQQKNEAIAKPEPIKPEPVKPKPVKPTPEIAKAPKKAAPLESNHPLLSKPQTKKPPVVSAQTPDAIKEPPAKKTPTPAIAKQPKPPKQEQPDQSTVAATSPPTQPQPAPQTPPPAAQPQQRTDATNSGAASLLGGNLSRSLATDKGSTFFQAQANASQTALKFNNSQNARRDPNLGPYFAEVRRKVKRNWRPSRPDDTKQTVLTFSIQRDGQISGLKVTQSSGSEQIDRESLAAVQNAAPFAALPASLDYPQLNVEFNFNLYLY